MDPYTGKQAELKEAAQSLAKFKELYECACMWVGELYSPTDDNGWYRAEGYGVGWDNKRQTRAKNMLKTRRARDEDRKELVRALTGREDAAMDGRESARENMERRLSAMRKDVEEREKRVEELKVKVKELRPSIGARIASRVLPKAKTKGKRQAEAQS